MSSIRRSLLYSIADSYISLPLQILGTMIMSRLLTPAETGVYAVAAVYAAFASTFRDFGVAEYLIQEKSLDTDKIRAAFTVNIAVSWMMGILLFTGAPFAASFYRDNGVADVMKVLSLNFVLIPFGAVTMANFRRLLDFRPIFIAGLLSNIGAFIVSTACAYKGMGYMSLAWSSLTGSIVTVAVSVWFRPKDFPRFPGFKGIREVIHFGKFASGVYVFGQLGKGAPEMVLGRLQDLTGVALFSKAMSLVDIFHRTVIKAVMPVCLPYFAKNNREIGNVSDGYLLSISHLTVIGWPFLAFMGIAAYAAVRILFGTQWLESIPLAQILCAAGAIELIHFLSKEVLIASGGVARSNTLQIRTQATRVAGLFLAIPYGLEGACWGLFAAAFAGFGYAQRELTIAISLNFRSIIKACSTSLYVTVISMSPIIAWVTFIESVSENNYYLVSLLGGSTSAVLWLIALRLFRHPLWNEICRVVYSLSKKQR